MGLADLFLSYILRNTLVSIISRSISFIQRHPILDMQTDRQTDRQAGRLVGRQIDGIRGDTLKLINDLLDNRKQAVVTQLAIYMGPIWGLYRHWDPYGECNRAPILDPILADPCKYTMSK